MPSLFRASIHAIRTSPAVPATIVGKPLSTPGIAADTLTCVDQLAPFVVEEEKYIRSEPPFAEPAFHSAYSAPAASEANAICGPRKPVSQFSASHEGGAPETSSSTVVHVRPPSADRLT